MIVSSQTKSTGQHCLSDGEIREQYRYWRLHTMLSLYIGYALFYFTRKSFNYAMPAMITDLGLDKGAIGLIGTLFYITYGCSKFLSGIISDRSNPRYFMGIGLIATGIINIFFGLSSSVVMFTVLWVLNAWFQGWWFSIMCQITHFLVLSFRAWILVVALEYVTSCRKCVGCIVCQFFNIAF